MESNNFRGMETQAPVVTSESNPHVAYDASRQARALHERCRMLKVDCADQAAIVQKDCNQLADWPDLASHACHSPSRTRRRHGETIAEHQGVHQTIQEVMWRTAAASVAASRCVRRFAGTCTRQDAREDPSRNELPRGQVWLYHLMLGDR